MEALARQRCLHHSTREAVARCPECGQFYCRECITEHDDRIICASCLKKLAAAEAQPRREPPNLWPVAQLAAGFVFAWMLFYFSGRILISLPEEFHDDKLWQARFMNAFQARGTGDE